VSLVSKQPAGHSGGCGGAGPARLRLIVMTASSPTTNTATHKDTQCSTFTVGRVSELNRGKKVMNKHTSALSILLLILLGACTSQTAIPSPSPPTVTPVLPPYVEIGYEDLQLRELGQDLLTDPGMPGCDLRDLPAFNWKLVDAGQVAIRTQEEYASQVDSLYSEGYVVFQENLSAFPDTYQSVPNYGYDEFLEMCNVFPEVDFSQKTILGNHASGTGCSVDFEKHVYRDEKNKRVLYAVDVIEEGLCEMYGWSRNLITIDSVPPDYRVEFVGSSLDD